MADNVISLDEKRKKKKQQQPHNPITNVMRESLDNDAVMRRYGIQQPTVEERMQRIRESCARINSLMNELKEKQK